MAKNKQNSIQEPTPEELSLYQQLIQDIDEGSMDMFASEYFDLVQQEKINISFAKFIIDKIIRPIKEGDTINMQDSNGNPVFLYCLIRKEIEGTDYLIFGMVNDEDEVIPEMVYLFKVIGRDENGMEIIDICESSPESERILDIMEADNDVEMAEKIIPEK